MSTPNKDEEHPLEVIIDENDKAKESKSGSSFRAALQAWVEIDLPSMQRKLDEQGILIKEEQKGSLVGRKNLAQKTKEFKKLEDAQKLTQVNSLIKLYQNEIDSLNNKKKNVENTFFNFYRSIAEAPDPRPLLEYSIDSVIQTSEAESLRHQVDTLTEELSKKADYESIKQRLLRSEQSSSELVSLKLLAQEKEFNALIDEKETNWNEKEKEYLRQINHSKEKIEELKTTNEISQLKLNNKNQDFEENNSYASASTLAELEITYREVEAAKKRVLELEKRNEELRRQLSASQNNINAEEKAIEEDLRKKLSEIEGDNALLIAKLDQQRKQNLDNNIESKKKIDSYEREVNLLKIEIDNLKNNLEKTSDYEEIKHELAFLRQIEFGEDEPEEALIETSKGKGFDYMLVKRNRAMNDELANLRSKHEELNNIIQTFEQQNTDLNSQLSKAKEMNRILESDLANLRDKAGGPKFKDNQSMISTISKFSTGTGKQNAAGSNSDDMSILPIITKQRDRFKERITELEDELKKQYNLTSDLRRSTNKLKQDNEELYEKVRYLVSFNEKEQGSSSKFFKPKPNTHDLESNPYKDGYESRLNPIEQFRIRESERISAKLSPLDRIFISFTRAVLATKASRTLFMVYCIALHCIVMSITIYAMNLHTEYIPDVSSNYSTGGTSA